MAPGRRRGDDRDPDPRASFLWFAGGGGLLLVLVKLATNHWFPPVALSLILIVVYGFVLWDREFRGPKFDHAGDNLYYVGFLYTLISLAVSLYRFTSAGYTEDIVRGFGVALSSTVFGLVGRVYVNQSFVGEPASVEAAARQSLVVAHRALRAEMDYAIEDYKRFREDLRELREAVERAKGVTAAETGALAEETARLEDVRGLASRLDRAVEAVGRMAERQEEMAVRVNEEAVATLRGFAARQEALSDGVAKAQQDALDRVAACVLDPAETRLRQLIDGMQPLIESLGSTQAEQQRGAEETKRVLEQLSRAFAGSEDLASRHQVASESLVRAARSLDALPEQMERQSVRSEAVARETAAAAECLRKISGALEGASASLATAAEALSKRSRGIFGFVRRR